MKKLLPILAFTFVAATLAPAQEAISLEDAQKHARILAQNAPGEATLQLKQSLNLDKPRGIKAGEVGLVVIPDDKLTADALEKAGKDATPIGQLWTRTATAAQDGKVTPNSKLRLITIAHGDQSAQVQLYLLGVRSPEKGKLELVLFGKDKEPLLKLPLEKSTGGGEFPIEVSGRKTGEESGVLTLTLLGKFKAELPLMKQED